jgi:hypothetical protein
MTANLRRLVMALATLAATLGPAEASDWVVSRVNPPAQHSADGETWRPLSVGAAIPDASWVRTGERGMLLLKRESDSILFKPGTLAEITSEFDGRAGTSIRQRSGALLLDVGKRDAPHIEVQTPFLAAVVKGTRFESRVGRSEGELEVRRGIVEVTHLRRGERIDLLAGQTARVGESAALPIVFLGSSAKPESEWVGPGEPVVPPLEGRDSPAKWGLDAPEQALLWHGGVSKAGVGIALAVIATLIVGVLIARQPMATPPASTVPGEGSAPRAAAKTPDRRASRGGLSVEGFLDTGMIATFSACIVGLVAIAIPGFGPVSVVAAMAFAFVVLLLIIRLSPSRSGS